MPYIVICPHCSYLIVESSKRDALYEAQLHLLTSHNEYLEVVDDSPRRRNLLLMSLPSAKTFQLVFARDTMLKRIYDNHRSALIHYVRHNRLLKPYP